MFAKHPVFVGYETLENSAAFSDEQSLIFGLVWFEEYIIYCSKGKKQKSETKCTPSTSSETVNCFGSSLDSVHKTRLQW